MRRYILYWMQQAQRVRYNQALNISINLAEKNDLPLVVCFIVTPFPEAEIAHYRFMLEGIKEVEAALEARNINFIIKSGEIIKEVVKLAEMADILIMDRGYLRIQREWRRSIQRQVACHVRIIDTDTVVPVMEVSDKAESAARTIRPKIKKLLPKYLTSISDPITLKLNKENIIKRDASRHKAIYDHYPENNSDYNSWFKGGYSQAKARLAHFIKNDLIQYYRFSRDPVKAYSSGLSPYLHFGQISALEIALEVTDSDLPRECKEAFLEQLIVRRELAFNFIWYNPDYDEYQGAVPEWARISLELHRDDKREFIYSLEEFEQAKTHDVYWNAAQNQLLKTGFMHNYMRMYWGKKIIEWTKSPEEAFNWMCRLNNKYQLDGRDANSYTGIAWCFGLHDHPWKERPVFGKIRYMNDKGLERKFEIYKYAELWNNET